MDSLYVGIGGVKILRIGGSPFCPTGTVRLILVSEMTRSQRPAESSL